MNYKEEILEGFFIKRYKRFFVDIKIGAKVVTAYCPNTGSLLGLLNEGSKVLVAKVENPNAKLINWITSNILIAVFELSLIHI